MERARAARQSTTQAALEASKAADEMARAVQEDRSLACVHRTYFGPLRGCQSVSATSFSPRTDAPFAHSLRESHLAPLTSHPAIRSGDRSYKTMKRMQSQAAEDEAGPAHDDFPGQDAPPVKMAHKPARVCLLIQGIPTPDKWRERAQRLRCSAALVTLAGQSKTERLHLHSSNPIRFEALGIPLFQPVRDEATMKLAEEPVYKEAYLATNVRGAAPAEGSSSSQGKQQAAPLPGWVEVVRCTHSPQNLARAPR